MARDLTPEKLKSIRDRLGLTQAALAEKLGLSRDQVSSMEQGRREIARITQLAIEHLSCKPG